MKKSKNINDYDVLSRLHSKKYNGYSCVYCIMNVINKKKYIGSTRNFKKRSETHLYRLRHDKHNNIHLQRAWNKYREKKFKWYILSPCSVKDLSKMEQKFITLFSTFDRKMGYNICEDAINKTCSEETKKRISDANKGENAYWFGKTFSLQTRNKMSKSRIGRKVSLVTRNKIRKSLIGQLFSEERKIKISNANKGNRAWNRGKSWSASMRKKLSKAHKGQIPFNKGKFFNKITRTYQ